MIDLSKNTILSFSNLLDKKTLQDIQKQINGNEFQWYWNETTLGKENFLEDETPQFTHSFMNYRVVNSNWLDLVKPILFAVESKVGQKFIPGRIKANLLCPIGKPHTHPAHADEELTSENNFFSFIFYPFDCDGDTILYDEFFKDSNTSDKKTVVLRNTPKENTCLFFNSCRLHASSTPINYKRRIVINFVVSVE